MIDSRTKSNTEATHCPFCGATLALESSECQSCGSDLSLFNAAALGWITVAGYAAATSTSEEAVLSARRHGDLDGQLICGKWLVLNESCG
jgi:hypothetical protein